MKKLRRILSASLVAVGTLLIPSALMAKQNASERIEVAFVLDTTGSMANLIEGAKRKIWSIANTVVDINPNADIRMALVAYRDYGDAYVVKTFDMSSDIQGLYGNLIQYKANGGGDTPEAVNEALDASVSKLNWSKGEQSRRIIFLVGDAPPHMDYNGPKYPEVIKNARSAGIVVHAVQAGSSRKTRNIWKDIAKRGGGSYIPIPQDGGKITVITTPYDNDIIILQRRIDKTVIPYGNRQRQSLLRQKMRTKTSASAAVRVENSKFYAKRTSRKEVMTGGGDIISDIRNKDVSLGMIAKKELPKQLQSLNPAEQKAYIAKKIGERSLLEKEMSALVKKHDAYTAKKTKEMAGKEPASSFDRAVSMAIQKSF